MKYRMLIAAVVATMFWAGNVVAEESQETEETAVEEVEVPSSDELLTVREGDVVLGNPDAAVTVIEYASMSCSHCGAFHGSVFKKLKEKYIETNKIKFILRDFPLDETALRAAQITRCGDSDRFYTFVDAIFTAQSNWVGRQNYLEVLSNIARLGGLSSEAIEACLADKELEERILKTKFYAVKGLEVRSTPTLFVNGQKYSGGRDITFLSGVIDSLLNAAE